MSDEQKKNDINDQEEEQDLEQELEQDQTVTISATATADDPERTAMLETTPVETEVAAEEEQEHSFWSEMKAWLRDLLVAAIVCVVLIVYIIQPFRVEKTSMEPLLFDGDRILVSKIAIAYEPIERGNIVVLWNPRNPEESWIKRVIGLPGETVQIADGYVYINGQRLEEPYLLPEERRPPKNEYPSTNARMLTQRYPERMREFGLVMLDEWETYSGSQVAVQIPQGFYFVCGDHRRYSMDSRDAIMAVDDIGPGLIPQKYIYGKAVFRYWPLKNFGAIKWPSYPELGAKETVVE
jgi:signal peptidase I